eukprot:scaffold184507_cov33-Tisochrysis_lutea.AAC.3
MQLSAIGLFFIVRGIESSSDRASIARIKGPFRIHAYVGPPRPPQIHRYSLDYLVALILLDFVALLGDR